MVVQLCLGGSAASCWGVSRMSFDPIRLGTLTVCTLIESILKLAPCSWVSHSRPFVFEPVDFRVKHELQRNATVVS